MDDPINYGIPHGATPLDPDDMAGLRLRHITTRAELDRWEQANIADAMSWLSVRRDRENVISVEFLTTLHRKMFEKVWDWAGIIRRSGKNIGVN